MAGTWGAIALSTARWSSTPMDICRSIALSSPATAAWAEVTCWARDVFDSPLSLVSGSEAQPETRASRTQATKGACQRMLREASSSIAAIAPFAPRCAEKSICFRMVRRRQDLLSISLIGVSKHALRIMKDLPPRQ
jgi:hypothetical protein